MIGKRHEYNVMAECERELWWYRCLHELTFNKIKEFSKDTNIQILDAGCGTGGMLAVLKENSYCNIKGFDLSPDAVALAKRVIEDVLLVDLMNVDKHYSHNSFDVIIAHDNLYFFTNGEDKEVVSKLALLLRPGGLLLINLPAGKLFRGSHDIAVGITERYSKKTVRNLAGDSVEISETIQWPFFLSSIIFFVRTLQRMKMLFKKNKSVTSDVKLPPTFLNHLFFKVTSWENRNWKAKLWGSSIFVTMRKR
jgi:SAM-dependent methyltransferase